MVIVLHNISRYSDDQVDGLLQERRNSSALAMELRLFCTNLWKCTSYMAPGIEGMIIM